MFMHRKLKKSAYTLENASIPILQDRSTVIQNAKAGGAGIGQKVYGMSLCCFLITA